MSAVVQVTFSDDVYAELWRIANEQGKTLEVVIQDAVSLAKLVADLRSDGGRLLIEQLDGTTKVVTRP